MAAATLTAASTSAATASSQNAKNRELTEYTATAGQQPELVDYSPWTDDIRDSNAATTLTAYVGDDSIKRVRFKVAYPDGTTSTFALGSSSDTTGTLTTWTYSVDTTGQSGTYSYMVRMADDDGHIIDSDWIEFLVADSDAELITAARSKISALCDDAWPDVNLCAKFVRHGFHDCVGGCDGCIDMSNGDNAGLDVTIAALEPVVDMFEHHGVTRADIWVLAALEASVWSQQTSTENTVEVSTTYPFTMNWIGRPNCEDIASDPAVDCVDGDCSAERGPHRDLPGPDLNTHELLDYFQTNFNFDTRDTVAIMGAHTLGELARENSGFDGPVGWTANNQFLTNNYYGELVGGTSATDEFETLMNAGSWSMTLVDNEGEGYDTTNRWQWERGTNEEKMFVMLNSDIAIVRDLSDDGSGNSYIDADGMVSGCVFKCKKQNGNGCTLPRCPYAAETWDIAVEYRFDADSFMTDFEDAFTRMLEWGEYDTSAGCFSPPCTLESIARRNLRTKKA